jgi:hypothetical protein
VQNLPAALAILREHVSSCAVKTTSILGSVILYWMALGTFSIGTEGFMIAPVLPNLAEDLSVSVVAAGQPEACGRRIEISDMRDCTHVLVPQTYAG